MEPVIWPGMPLKRRAAEELLLAEVVVAVELWGLGLLPREERAEEGQKVWKARMERLREQRCDLHNWEDRVAAGEVAEGPLRLQSLFPGAEPWF